MESDEIGCHGDLIIYQVDIYSLGIDEINKSTLNIYPNPSSNHIITETSGTGQISILNLIGEEILKQIIKEPKTILDVSTLPSGVYVVKVIGEKGVQIGKIMKE